MCYSIKQGGYIMKQLNTKPEIINQYLLLYFEIISIKLTYLSYKKNIQNVFGNNERIFNTLKKEMDEYLNAINVELEILKFMLKNEKKLYVSDIYNVLNKFNENYKERYFYMENLYGNLQTALEMEFEYKFYAPRYKPKYLIKEDISSYITYLKGFNIDRIKEFLINEQIYDEQSLDKVLENTKILDVDAKENIDMFGVCDKGVIIPKIKDSLSSLINIHELVHQALLNKKDILDEEIVFCEDLPKFYELLFKSFNIYINEECNESEIALELLENYNEEIFEEQINKLNKIKNSKR